MYFVSGSGSDSDFLFLRIFYAKFYAQMMMSLGTKGTYDLLHIWQTYRAYIQIAH